MKLNKNKNLGFTLIETIIYIALFSILMGSVFVTAFQLIDGNNDLNAKIVVQEEGNFVMRKFDWLLTGLDSLNPPTVSGTGCAQTLTVRKINFPLNPIVVRINTNTLEISEAGGSFVPITTSNVSVTCLKARIIPTIVTSPSGITATTTINGIDFSITKYFRK